MLNQSLQAFIKFFTGFCYLSCMFSCLLLLPAISNRLEKGKERDWRSYHHALPQSILD